MTTYEARILLDVDGETIGEMLASLQSFTNSITGTPTARVTGFQWDRPKNEEVKPLDIRKPGWVRHAINYRGR